MAERLENPGVDNLERFRTTKRALLNGEVLFLGNPLMWINSAFMRNSSLVNENPYLFYATIAGDFAFLLLAYRTIRLKPHIYRGFEDLDIKPQGMEEFGQILYKDQKAIFKDALWQKRFLTLQTRTFDPFGSPGENVMNRMLRGHEDFYLQEVINYQSQRDDDLPDVLKTKYARWTASTIVLALHRAAIQRNTREEVSESLILSARKALLAAAEISAHSGEIIESKWFHNLLGNVLKADLEEPKLIHSLERFVNNPSITP